MRGIGAVVIWFVLGFALAAQTVPDPVMQRLQKDPAPYLELASNLIHGFGGAQGIDRAGIANFVALQRAEERASAMRKLLLADLDFDDQITRAEMAVLSASVSAYQRGKLWKRYEQADDNADGLVMPAELAVFSRAEAMRLFSAADEAEAMSVLTFDGNQDGWVDLKEVTEALAAMGI